MISTVFGTNSGRGIGPVAVRTTAAAFVLACAAHAGISSFVPTPSAGAIFGAPGTSIGWGYTLDNASDDGEWLVTTGLSSDAFLYGTPNLFFDFPILAPGTSLSVPFSDINLTGLYQLIWDADAPLGFINIGAFELSAQWWTADPGQGGVYLSDAILPPVSYSAEVFLAPEPGACGLLAAALTVFLLFHRTVLKRNVVFRST